MEEEIIRRIHKPESRKSKLKLFKLYVDGTFADKFSWMAEEIIKRIHKPESRKSKLKLFKLYLLMVPKSNQKSVI